MQKWPPVVLILGIIALAVFLSGCINLTIGPQTVPVVTPMQTTVTTTAPATTVATTLPTHTQETMRVTPVLTSTMVTTTAATTGDPLPKRLTFNLAANAVDRFTVQNTGKVRFDITYGTSTGEDTECTARTAYLTLSGPGYDNVLDYHNAATSSRKVLDLKAGSYVLSTNGCKGWKVVISNNF